jgi:hypothetical protein
MASRDSPKAAPRTAETALSQLAAARKPFWFGISTSQKAEPCQFL